LAGYWVNLPLSFRGFHGGNWENYNFRDVMPWAVYKCFEVAQETAEIIIRSKDLGTGTSKTLESTYRNTVHHSPKDSRIFFNFLDFHRVYL
jgi:hypothetical protein